MTKRPEVSEAARSLLQKKLAPYGLVVDGYNIIDFNFSEEFNRAIEASKPPNKWRSRPGGIWSASA
ncbi:hypothetical protein [Thermaerobacter litoralis]